MALGVGGGELAAGIAGAGDEAAADRARLDADAERGQRGDADADILVGDVGDQQVLPDREPQRAAAEALGDLGQAAHLLGGDAADRQHDAEIVEARLLLGVHADMAVLVGHRPRIEHDARHATQRGAVFLLDLLQEFVAAHPIEHVFQPRLGAVGAVAVGDEGAHHGAGHLHAFLGLQQHAGLVREILVAGDAAELQAEVDAVRRARGDEADVVGVFQHRHLAAAVEGDVELARQAVHLAVIEDVVMHRAAQRPRVDQLLRVDAGGRAAGDVADIVGARAARGEAERLHGEQQVDRMVGRDLADLQVGARRHVGIAAAEGVGGIGQAAHLPGVQDAVGHAQPAHEGILGRRDVEKPMILGQENIDALGELALLGALDDLVPAVERMALALGLLLRDQLAAGRPTAVLRSVLQRVGPARRCRRPLSPPRRGKRILSRLLRPTVTAAPQAAAELQRRPASPPCARRGRW